MIIEWKKEEHPNWYKDIPKMRYLILGSFPPHHSKRDYPFYYPNKRNRFWKILAELAGHKLHWTKDLDTKLAVQERHTIMETLQVGVQNLGLEIERKGISTLDTDIRITKFQDIISILEVHPELEMILLPGFSAPDSTAKSFSRYISDHCLGNCSIEDIKPHYIFQVNYKGRVLNCVVLNSTSTASRIKYEALLDQFKKYIQ
jgi:G:T/U-mismatch repair DNA glycosylase